METNNQNKKLGFFEDSNGGFSMIRLLSLLTLIFAFLLIAYQVFTDKINIELIIILMIAAFAPKVFQKYYEKMPWLGGSSSTNLTNNQENGNGIYCRSCNKRPIISQRFYAQDFHQQHQGVEEGDPRAGSGDKE